MGLFFFYFVWRPSKQKQRYVIFYIWCPSSLKEICAKTLRSYSMKLNNSWQVAKELSTCHENRTYGITALIRDPVIWILGYSIFLIHILSNVILLITNELRRVVCRLTRLWVELSGALHRGSKRGLLFSKMHRTSLQPATQPPFKWVPCSFPPTIILTTHNHLLSLYASIVCTSVNLPLTSISIYDWPHF